jgi:hypothetical protein
MKSDTAFPSFVALLFLAALVLMLLFCTGCGMEYPVTLSLHSDYGKASYSSKGGLEIIIEK